MLFRSGASTLYLSRNNLGGSIAALGAHHTSVHVNHNHLEGDLNAAVINVKKLKHLNANRNNLTGTLEFVRGKTDLRQVHVADNKMYDTASSPAHAHLAANRRLQGYDITGNPFTPIAELGGGGVRAERSSVHVVIRMGTAVSHFCPHCDSWSSEHNCGVVKECRKRPGIAEHLPTDDARVSNLIAHTLPEVREWEEQSDVVDAMECTLRRAAVAGVGAGGEAEVGAGALVLVAGRQQHLLACALLVLRHVRLLDRKSVV